MNDSKLYATRERYGRLFTEVTIIPNGLIDDSRALLNEIEVFQTHLSADNYIITRTDVRECLENVSKYLKIIIEHGEENRRNI